MGRPLPRVKVLCAVLASCLAAGAFANPTGPSVVSGSAGFSSAGGSLTVSNSPNAIINWQGFSIGAGEITRFQQQSAASAVLNRVVGQDPSAILGTLWSNGRVFLVNPNGIVFGQGSRVDAAAFGASTLNISDADFLGGRLNFQAGAIARPIVNQGELQSATGGYIYLVSPDITNSGLISSPKGDVVLAAGRTVSLADIGTPNLKVEVSAPEATVRNLGQIMADSGRIGVYAGLINQQGSVQANSASRDATGRIVLRASDTALLEQGSVTSASGAAGGEIRVLGNKVGLIGNAIIDASGETGGGTVLVGGDYQGSNPNVQNAFRTYFGQDATIKADALGSGDGGKVIVWSDDATRAYGSISARGGAQAGNGGFVEVSGKRWLDFNASVDTRAPAGTTGKLLLDPTDIQINAADGGLPNTALTVNLFQDTGAVATSEIVASNLETLLGTSSVTINTQNGAGAGPLGGTVTFNASVAKPNAGGTTVLDVIAERDIIVAGGVSISAASTANPLWVRFFANSTGGGGGIRIGDGVTTATIDTKGGAVYLGGGQPGAGTQAVGTSGTGGMGVHLNKATINAGDGTIELYGTGQSGAGVSQAVGIHLTNGSIVQTTTSAIVLNGVGGTNAFGGSPKGGVRIADDSKISTVDGPIQITGVGSAVAGTTGPSLGIDISPAIIEATGTGSILLNGTGGAATGGFNLGIGIFGATTRISSTSGSVTLNGIGGANGSSAHGIYVQNSAQINSTTGPINLTGDMLSNSGTEFGIMLQSARVQSTASGPIDIRSPGLSGRISLAGAPGDFISTAGSLTLYATPPGSISQGSMSIAAGPTAITGGTITLTNAANDFGGPVTLSGGGSVSLRDVNSLTLGPANVTALDVVSGGTVTFTGNVTKPFSGGATTLQVQAQQDIVVAGGVSISAAGTGNPLSVVFYPNRGAAGGSIVLNGGASVDTKGGNVTLGDSVLGSPVGTAASGGNGVLISSGASINAGAGPVNIRGTGMSAAPGEAKGIALDGVVQTTSGGISLTGLGGDGPTAGVSKGGVKVAGTVSTATGAINITGSGSPSITNVFDSLGIDITGGIVEATGTGSITMIGTGGAATGGVNHGVAMFGSASRISSVSGGISITGNPGTNGFNDGISWNAGQITSTSGPISMASPGLSGTIALLGGPGDLLSTGGNAALSANTISQTAVPIVTGGATTLGGGTISLTNSSNDFNTVSVNATGGVSIRDTNSLTLSTVNVQSLDVVSGGTVTFTGNVAKLPSGGATPLRVQANADIVAGAVSISAADTANPLSVEFHANGGGAGGGIVFTGTTIDTMGGSVYLGGRLGVPGAHAVGTAASFGNGVRLFNSIITSGSGPVAIHGTGQPGAYDSNGIFFNGGVVQTTTGAILLDGLGGQVGAGNTSTITAGVYIGAQNTSRVSTVDGAVQIVGTGSSSPASTGPSLGITVDSGATIAATGTGSISMIGAGGASPYGFGVGVLANVSGTRIRAANGPITINGTGGAPATGGGNVGIFLTSGVLVESTGLGSVTLNGTGGATGSGSSGIVMASGAQIASTTGAIALNGSAVSGQIGIDLSSGLVQSTASGQVSLASPGPGGSILMQGSSGDVISTAGPVTLSAASISQTQLPIVAGGLTSISGGTMSLNASNNNFATVSLSTTGNVSLTDANAINFATSSTGASSLTVNAGGAITQTGPITAGAASFSAGSNPITLTNASNDFTGAVSLTGSSASITDANALVLGTTSLGSGSLAVIASGPISQSGPITAGTASLNAGSNTITLANALNDFTGAVSLTGSSAQITDGNALALGTLALGGNLTAVSTGALNLGQGTVGGNVLATSNGGAITQSGSLAVTGSSTLNAGAGSITLANASNDFTGALSLTGSSAAIIDANALVLGSVSLGGGNLTVNTSGAITQSGPITAGTSSFFAGASPITLGNAGNDFSGTVTLTGGAASLTDANALVLGPVTVASLNVTTGGAITQSAPLTVIGASSFSAGSNPITLTNTSNDFTGAVSLGGGAVSITDTNALTLGLVNASSLTANATSITQDASGIVVSGTSTLNAGSITLTAATNDFGTVSATSAGSVSLTDTNALVLGTTSASSLNVTAGGAITQSGAATVSGASSFAAGANPITLTNAANDFGGTVSVTGGAVAITDANAISFGASSAGSLTVNAGGAITQTAPITAGAASFNAGASPITLMEAGNDFTGAVTLTGSSASITDANALTLGTVSLGSGSLAVSASGAITQSGPITAGPATFFTLPASPITLTNAGNDFSGTVTLTGGAASLTDANALVLGPVTVSSLNVTAGGAITQSAPLTVIGASSFAAGSNPITLANAGNDFGGAVSLGGGAVSITDTNALTLGLVNASSLTANATSITQDASGVTVSGTATLNAGSIALALGTNDFGTVVATSAGPVALADANSITLGATSAASLSVTAFGGAITQSGPITAGSSSFFAGASPITLTNAGNDFTGPVTLGGGIVAITDANALTLGLVNASSLTANATSITQDASGIVVSGTSTLNAGSITLTAATNDFGTFAATSAGNVSLTDTNALVLGPTSASSLNVIAGGAITQTGPIAAGTSSFSAGANPITLTNAGNDFTGAVSLTGGAVSIIDANALDLGSVSVSSLNVTAGGAITQSAPLTVIGTSSFAAGSNPITLANAGNDFGGAVSLGGGAVSITDANALTLGLVNTSSLTVNAGSIVQNASGVTVSGTTTLNAGSITLTAATNDFGTLAAISGGSVAVTDANAISLGAINAASLNVTAGGAITQSGAATVSGTSSFAAGANPIALTNTSNDFTGAVSLTGGTVAITDINALTLGTLSTGDLSAVATGALNLGQGTVGGNLVATSNGGAITQSGPMAVTGSSTLNAGTNSITLANAANDFTGAVILLNSGANPVQIADANALVLGTSSVGQNLTVTSGGPITQSGPLTVPGTSSFSAGANPVTLTNAGNDFTGAVTLSGGAASLTDANALDLGAVSVSSLNVVSGGAITQSAPLGVSGTATFAAGSNAITLASATNDFGGPVSLGGSVVAVTDANALTLGLVNASSLTANATSITQDASGLSVSGTTTLNAGSIALTTATNVFGTLAVTSGGSVILTDANAVSLGAINAASLNVTAGGAITQSAPLSVSGVSTFAAGANPITLTNASNDFTGAVSLTGSSAAITDANALTLGTVALGGGSLTVTTSGAITQTGPITAGASSFSAGANPITLTNAGNDFTGAVSLTGGAVSLTDANALDLGSVSVSSLNVVAGGAITQSAPITAGTTSLSAGSNAITLSNASNDFTGAVSLTGGAVSITDANALTLGTLATGALTAVSTGALNLGQGAVGGDLVATSNGGAITQSGGLTVAGTSSLNAGASSITLTNASNDFNGAVSLSGSSGSITDANALTLGTVSLGGGSLVVSASGAITQSGSITAGAASFNAGSNPITLTNPGNDFSGAVSLSGADVTITDANALTLAAVNATSLTANCASFNQGGAGILVTGPTTLNAGQITLNSATNALDTVNVAGTLDASTGTLAAVTWNLLPGGTLKGAGTVTGNVNNSGTISPGASPGTLTINGNFVQAPGGVLNMEIAGPTPGTQHDQLIVNGNATLGGTLNATPFGGFSLAPGNSFALVRSSGVITGTFGAIAQPGGVLLNGLYGPASFDLIVSTGSVPPAVQPSLNYAVATTQPASTPTTTQSSPVPTAAAISESESAASTSESGATTEEKRIVGRPLRCKS